MVDKDNQAERSVFEAWHKSEFSDVEFKLLFNAYLVTSGTARPHGSFAINERWKAWQAARAAQPALDAEGLPALPKPVRMSADQAYLGYTVEQVRQAQRDAVAADRQSRISADQWASLEQARLHAEAVKERRLARQGQQPARASVADDPKFLSLLADIYSAGICYSSAEVDRAVLIAHINAWGGVTEDHTKQEK